MKFTYEAFDAAGKRLRGSCEAPTAADATESLRRQGLYVASVEESRGGSDVGAGDAAPLAGGQRVKIGKGRKLKNLAIFTRQLSVLVASGTPLADALGALERQSKDKAWRQVVAALRLRVEEGMPLSEAMGTFPDVFDAVARSMVAAGEAGGIFDVMLDRLAVLSKKQLHVRQAINGAMVYPCLLIVLAISVLCVMLLFVLPRFTDLFKSLDAPLPVTTEYLMRASAFLRSYWWAVILGIGTAVFGVRYWLGTPGGKRTIDTLVVRAPVVRELIRPFAVARIVRVLGTLLNGRLPMLDALALARQTATNVYYNKLVADAEEAVNAGQTVSSAFAAGGDLVSPSVIEAIKSGEQSGQIATLLLNMADFLDEENEVVVKSLTSILEPMILIGLGVMVGLIAISMFLPLFDLTSMAGGGH